MGIGSGWKRHEPAAASREKRDGEAVELSGFLFIKGQEAEKRILFFKNEARKLLKTKGGCGKNSQNEAKTKLAILLKIQERPKNEPKAEITSTQSRC